MDATRSRNAADLTRRTAWTHRHQGKNFHTGLRRAIDHALRDAPSGRQILRRRDLQALFDQGYEVGLAAARAYLERIEEIKVKVRASDLPDLPDDATDDQWFEASIALTPMHLVFPSAQRIGA